MSRSYEAITAAALAEDSEFCKYLWTAQIKAGNRGGTFVGNRTVAPAEFRKYGIVLPKGGMILPQVEPATLLAIMAGNESPLPVVEEYEMDRNLEYFLEDGPNAPS